MGENDMDVLTLMDEDGQEHEFELVDSAEIDGQNYVALVPIFDQPDELLADSGELVILRSVDDEGEEYLEPIDNEEEFNRVGAYFMSRLEDEYDFEEES